MDGRRFRCAALLILLASACRIAAGQVTEKRSIWDVLRDMPSVSINEAAIQAFFGARIDTRSDNGAWRSYEGKGRALGDGVKISRFGFMTKNDSSSAPWVYMDLEGPCVKFADVRKMYPGLVADAAAATVHAPRSLYWSINEDREVKFSFTSNAMLRADCLANVGVSPRK